MPARPCRGADRGLCRASLESGRLSPGRLGCEGSRILRPPADADRICRRQGAAGIPGQRPFSLSGRNFFDAPRFSLRFSGVAAPDSPCPAGSGPFCLAPLRGFSCRPFLLFPRPRRNASARFPCAGRSSPADRHHRLRLRKVRLLRLRRPFPLTEQGPGISGRIPLRFATSPFRGIPA